MKKSTLALIGAMIISAVVSVIASLMNTNVTGMILVFSVYNYFMDTRE